MATMTIATKFAATIAILEGRDPEVEFDTAMAVEFLKDRAEKATRKSTTKSVRKPKPETVECRAEVTAFVSQVGGEFKCKDVVEATGRSSQACAAALRFLKAEGVVAEVETEGKGAKVWQFIG